MTKDKNGRISSITPGEFEILLWFVLATEAFKLISSNAGFKIEQHFDKLIDYDSGKHWFLSDTK